MTYSQIIILIHIICYKYVVITYDRVLSEQNLSLICSHELMPLSHILYHSSLHLLCTILRISISKSTLHINSNSVDCGLIITVRIHFPVSVSWLIIFSKLNLILLILIPHFILVFNSLGFISFVISYSKSIFITFTIPIPIHTHLQHTIYYLKLIHTFSP